MGRRKILAAILAIAIIITSIQLPLVQVNAEETTESKKYENTDILMENARANSEESGNPGDSGNVDGNAKCAFDDPNATTWWHTQWSNGGPGALTGSNSMWIQTGFEEEWYLDKIVYTTRENGYCAIHNYEIWVANADAALGQSPSEEYGWTRVVSDGELPDGKSYDDPDTNAETTVFDIELPEVVKAKYVCINVSSVYTNGCNGAYVIAKNIDFYGYDELPVADKTELLQVIGQAEAIEKSAYRLDSYKAVEDALAEAYKVNERTGATQNAVDAAKEALRATIDQLILKTTELRTFDCAILAANAKANSWMENEEEHNGSASAAFDADTTHWWHSNYKASDDPNNINGQVINNSIWIQTGFGGEWNIESIDYRTKGSNTYNQIKDYEIYIATTDTDPQEGDWKLIKSGSFESSVAAGTERKIELGKIVPATYVRIKVTSIQEDSDNTYVAGKFKIYGYDEDPMATKDHWTFDDSWTEETVTMVKSEFGDKRTGSLNGSHISIIDSGNPVFGNVLHFDENNNDSYMRVADYINTGASNAKVSFSMWYRYTTEDTNEVVLLQHENADPAQGRVLISLKSDGKYESYLGNNASKSTAGVERGDWQHITVTFDREKNKASFYINGEVSGENVALGSEYVDAVLPLRIGLHKNVTSPMHGDIDELYVFNKVLTAEEAKAIYDEKAVELANYKEELKTELADVIEEAEALYNEADKLSEAEGIDPSDIDAAHVDAFEAVKTKVDAGKTVSENGTIEEIQAATDEIEEAIEELRAVYLDGVKLTGNSLTLDGVIDVNFYMQLKDKDALESAGAYMNFTIVHGENDKEVIKVPVSAATLKDGDVYVFSCGVPVKDMDKEIKAQLVLPVSETEVRTGLVYTYSVGEYIEKAQEEPETILPAGATAEQIEKFTTLVDTMSDFGGFATAYFSKNSVTDESMLNKIEGVTTKELSDYALAEGDIPENREIYYGSSLLLKSDTELRHYFTEEVRVVSVTVGGEDVVSSKYAIKEKQGTSLYYLEYTGIGAHELGQKITVTVATIDDGEELTIVYSPLTYAYITLEDETDEALADLMRAMYLYQKAAQAYIN